MAQLLRAFLLPMCMGVVALSFSACRSFDPEGEYQGNYFHLKQGVSQVDPVQIEIHSIPLHRYHVVVKNLKNQKIVELSLFLNHLQQLTLHFSESKLWIPLHLVKSPLKHPPQAELLSRKQGCYLGAGEDSQRIQLCFNSELFSLMIFDQSSHLLWSISGRKYQAKPEEASEVPRGFTLNEALKRALSQGFDFQSSLQQLIQAKYSAQAAWLNLIPSLGTALVWNVEPGYANSIATAQVLTPFLLPSKWLRAKQASLEARAAQAAQWVVHANIAAQVEQLSYAFHRDARIVQSYQKVLNLLLRWSGRLSVHTENDARGSSSEWMGSSVSSTSSLSLPSSVGSHFSSFFGPIDSHEWVQSVKSSPHLEMLLQIQRVVEWLQGLKLAADQVYQEDQYALSLALGFKDPEAVARVEPEEETRSLEDLEWLDRKELAHWGVQRSFELEEVGLLIHAAEKRKKQIYFMWIDPTMDSTYQLGPQLGAQVGVAQSEVEQLVVKRNEIQAHIHQEAYRVSQEWNQSIIQLKKHDLRRKVYEGHEVDLEGWMSERVHQNSLDADSLRKAIQLYLAHELERQIDWAAFHIAESKKNRILLNGSFERLLPVFEHTQ